MIRKQLLPRLRLQARELLAAGGCMGLVAASLGTQVLLVRHALDALLLSQQRSALPWLAGAVGLAMMGQSLGELGRGFFMRRAGLRVMRRLRRDLFCHLQRFSVEQLEQRTQGELSTLLGSDVESIQRLLTVAITLGQKPLSLMVLIGAALWQEPGLTGLALALLPLILVPLQRLKRWIRHRTQAAQRAQEVLQEVMGMAYVGARTIQGLQLEPKLAARFEDALEQQERAQLDALLATQLSGPVTQLVSAVGVALAIWLGGWWVLEGEKTAGSLVAFVLSLGLMVDPFKSLAQVPLLWSQARVGLERTFALLEEQPVLQDGWRSLPQPLEHWQLELHGVSVKRGQTYTLKDISLTLKSGEWVALTGPSGSGKSTLLSLLARWLEPTEGSIHLNGHPLSEYRLASLRSLFSVVPQEIFLFPDAIRDNLWPVKECSASTQAQLVNELKSLGFSEDWKAGEGGLEAPVGSGESLLSGGERQRLAVLRALLRPSQCLLLDEPAGALDALNEQRLGERLERERGVRTVVMATHQESLAARADRVVKLEGGRILRDDPYKALSSES